jgi:hypothetical protein
VPFSRRSRTEDQGIISCQESHGKKGGIAELKRFRLVGYPKQSVEVATSHPSQLMSFSQDASSFLPLALA